MRVALKTTAALMLTVALPVVLLGCASDAGDERPRQSHARSTRPALPDPRQLDPPAGLEPLTRHEVDRVVAAALADHTVAAALEQGRVGRVLVRAAATGMPRGDAAGSVAFLFERAVRPRRTVFEVLCDIAGQTPEWRGVAARVVFRDGEVMSSPIWLTGANCVGLVLPSE